MKKKTTRHHRPQCAKWFSRYFISKSGIWARWTSPFCRFSASFSLKYDVTDAILQENEKMKVEYLRKAKLTCLLLTACKISNKSNKRLMRYCTFTFSISCSIASVTSYFIEKEAKNLQNGDVAPGKFVTGDSALER